MIKECDPQPVFASYERDVYSPETREHRRSTRSQVFPSWPLKPIGRFPSLIKKLEHGNDSFLGQALCRPTFPHK
jgi:hypothetical protein